MTNTPATRRKRSPYTSGQLRKRLAQFQKVLASESHVTDGYHELIAESDYLRITNTNQAERQRELSLDCLTLLLIAIFECDDFQFSGSRKRFLGRCAEVATPDVALQLRFVASVQNEEIFEEAKSIYEFAVGLMQRTGMDSGEQLLSELDRTARKTIGLYFTPPHLAEKLVNRVQDCLKSFGAGQGGLKDHKSLRVLDPAAGAGIVLLEWLDAIKSRPFFDSQLGLQVAQNMSGIELHPAVATLCHCRIFRWCEHAFEGDVPERINIHCGDALRILGDAKPENALRKSNIVIGNPPFNSLSNNSNDWIKCLMAGEIDGVSYTELKGEPIAERKSWLHDDYIKFFRLAQFLVESNNQGIIAFVSNRSFIDNVTFRGMRWQLLKSFDEIYVQEHPASEGHFAIATDVASSVLIKSSHDTQTQTNVEYCKANKTTVFHPQSPNYFFRPTVKTPQKYLDSISVKKAFQVQGSAAITARDWFITDLNRTRLVKRIEEFCDANNSDNAIRQRFFNRCRSRRYVPGDTRSWQLSPTRVWLAAQDWEKAIRNCCYRPFDQRWILWLPEMIDWPRTELMETVGIPNNPSLVTRRQFPADQPACYFWIVDGITIDGIIRSDNRGNERIFPMLRLDDNGESVSNFTEAILQIASSRWARFSADSFDSNRLTKTLFHYAYGLFHTPAYRNQFRDALSNDYPRILFSNCELETSKVAECGRQLMELHLPGKQDEDAEVTDRGESIVTSSPTFQQPGEIKMGDFIFPDVSLEDWEFRVGTHQVLRKWIADRKGITWQESFGLHYQKIIDSIQSTRRLTDQLREIELV